MSTPRWRTDLLARPNLADSPKQFGWWRWLPPLLTVWLAACSGVRPPAFRLADYPGTIRVACVGDSITWGAGVEHRETNNYPAVLGRSLGPKFEVRNFGVSGATVLKQGDKPYWNQPELAALDGFAPQLIILMLGTNDTKSQNWQYAQEFEPNFAALVDHLAHLPGHPKIWVCLPVPVYETRWGINDDTLVNGVIPAIRRVAQARGVPLIDLYDALGNRPELFADKIHPNAAGAEVIAHTVESALQAQ